MLEDQLQLRRDPHDPSQPLLPSHVLLPTTVAHANPSCRDLSALAIPAHSQPEPLQLPYPRIWQKREDPKIASHSGLPRTAATILKSVLQQRIGTHLQSLHRSGNQFCASFHGISHLLSSEHIQTVFYLSCLSVHNTYCIFHATIPQGAKQYATEKAFLTLYSTPWVLSQVGPCVLLGKEPCVHIMSLWG